MKTLGQVEPRTPVSAAQTIAASGSYYLTQNISGTIVIDASIVDLDLSGFTLSGGNPNGVTINPGQGGIRIFNGTIENSLTAGVGGSGVAAVHLHDLRINGGQSCVSFFNPEGHIEVDHIDCSDTLKSGINLVAISTLPLVALVHDNFVASTNTDGIAPGASINVANNGTNDGTWANVASSAGTVTENTTSFCDRGLVVVGNFIVTKNLAQNSDLEDYNFEQAPNAAAIKGINDSPGPWNNIANQTPVPEA